MPGDLLSPSSDPAPEGSYHFHLVLSQGPLLPWLLEKIADKTDLCVSGSGNSPGFVEMKFCMPGDRNQMHRQPLVFQCHRNAVKH